MTLACPPWDCLFGTEVEYQFSVREMSVVRDVREVLRQFPSDAPVYHTPCSLILQLSRQILIILFMLHVLLVFVMLLLFMFTAVTSDLSEA